MNTIDLDTLSTVTGGTSATNQLIQQQLASMTSTLQNQNNNPQTQQQQLMMGLAMGSMLRR